MKKILFIFGTRPEAIKIAPVYNKFLKNKKFKTYVCITSQHKKMLSEVIDIFGIKVDYDLNIMKKNQDIEHVTTSILKKLNNLFKIFSPDLVIVHGDMDSAITEYAKRTMGMKFNRNSIAMFTNKFLGGIGRILLDTDANIMLVDNAGRAARIITAVCKMKPVDRPVYTPTLIKQKISTGDLRLDVLSSICLTFCLE